MKNQTNFSPFLRLYKYRPTIKNTPKENFVTESFALCLFYNPEITKLFLKEFFQINSDKQIIIGTQVPHKDSIFDLTLTDTLNFYITIECKMGASVGKKSSKGLDQLEKYIDHLKGFSTQDKYLMLIDIGELIADKNDTDVIYKATRWNDIRLFLEGQSGITEVGEFLRKSFVDLLLHLKVDRKIINGKLSWKCDLCPNEMIGQGIYSHRKKHEREAKYIQLINDINSKTKSEFEDIVTPYHSIIEEMKKELKVGKIEKNNFSDKAIITGILEKKLPKNIWIYFIEQIKYRFSNKAFLDYRNEIINRLRFEKQNIIEEPQYLSTSYENIVKVLTGKEIM